MQTLTAFCCIVSFLCSTTLTFSRAAAQSFVLHGNAANGPLTSSVGNAAARFLATMTSHVDGVEQLNSWEYSEASRRSLATVKDECAGQTFEYCRDIVTGRLSQACGSSYDVSNNGGYETHPSGGAWGFLSGMTGLTGSTNYVELLVAGNDFSTLSVEDWWQSYLSAMWFWWMFLAVAILFAIGLCVWSPVLCSESYRSSVRCCKLDEDQYDSMKETSKRPKVILIVFLASVIWALVFAILALIYGIYVASGVRNIECTSWRVTYGMLFGDTAYAAEHTWSGLMGVDGSFVEYGGSLELVDANLTVQGEAFQNPLALPSTIEASLVEVVHYQDHLAKTLLRMASDRKRFQPWNAAENDQYEFYGTSHQQCLACEASHFFSPDTIDIQANFTAFMESAGTLINEYQSAVLQPLVVEIPTVSSKLEGDRVSNQMLTIAQGVSNVQTHFNSASVAMYVFFILVPLIVIALGIVVSFVVYRRYKSANNPSDGSLESNSFGSFCCAFGCLSAFLLIVGILLMAATQPVAEGCYWIEHDLFRDNSYHQYDYFSGIANASTVQQFTDSCATYSGDGQLVDTVVATIGNNISEMATVDQSIDALRTEISLEMEATMSDAQTTTYDGIGAALMSSTYLIHTSTEQKYLDPDLDDYEPRAYTLYKEFLYGGLQLDDVAVDALTQILATRLKEISMLAITDHNTYSLMEGVTMDKAGLLSEVNVTTTHFYGMKSQELRLNDALPIFNCNAYSLCYSTNWDNPTCCGELSNCVELRGVRTVIIQPSLNDTGTSASRGEFFLYETINHVANEGLLGELLKCVGQSVMANPTVDAIATEAVLFVNSLFFAGYRLRTLNGDYPFTMYSQDNYIHTNVPYDEFVNRSYENWDRIYNFDIITGPTNLVLDVISTVADDAEYYYNVIRRELQCSLFFDSMAGGENYLCAEITADLGLLGLWWVMIALGLLFPMMVMYWLIDDNNDDDDYYKSTKCKLCGEVLDDCCYCADGANSHVDEAGENSTYYEDQNQSHFESHNQSHFESQNESYYQDQNQSYSDGPGRSYYDQSHSGYGAPGRSNSHYDY